MFKKLEQNHKQTKNERRAEWKQKKDKRVFISILHKWYPWLDLENSPLKKAQGHGA